MGKQKLWDFLSITLASFPEEPFILHWEFNAQSIRDKTRGIVPPIVSMENFNDFVLNNGLKY